MNSYAKEWVQRRATADARMATAPTYEPEERATAPTGPGDVWCSHCAERATVEARLTTGETQSYCMACVRRLTIQCGLSALKNSAVWSELQ